MPCISLSLQLKTHSNYRKRWRDRSDLALLRKLGEGSATTLIVPVPAADGAAREVGARGRSAAAHHGLLPLSQRRARSMRRPSPRSRRCWRRSPPSTSSCRVSGAFQASCTSLPTPRAVRGDDRSACGALARSPALRRRLRGDHPPPHRRLRRADPWRTGRAATGARARRGGVADEPGRPSLDATPERLPAAFAAPRRRRRSSAARLIARVCIARWFWSRCWLCRCCCRRG